ncbi:Prolamin-like domain [Arabidopsis thaliana x Arabidopsis arenosa]|uniref:Prolamin-like domain n=1 Tax=Arabidopsis thaliana x Arabidopsis arenosa TaxID=1240361 RepID=A0A8T1YBY7_9BRAS|nr:Prolamin-like domain [Arabidopsis thaliana x Arabidopsis arenosa]
MAKSLLMVMLVSIVMFYMARPIFSQEVHEDVVISPTPFEEANSPAMEYDMNLPHYSQKEIDFLKACVEKPSSICGGEIFQNVLDEKNLVTDECCRDILKIGKDCHLGLIKIIFSSYEYKNIASIPRSKQTWNDCVRRVGSKIGAPVSFETLN